MTGLRTMDNKKMGRPKKQLDYELIERMAGKFCTQQDIADTLDVALRTLHNDKHFAQAYNKGVANAKSSLRAKQYDVAMSGNVTMLVWLGKQYLSQREPQAEVVVPGESLDDDMAEFDE